MCSYHVTIQYMTTVDVPHKVHDGVKLQGDIQQLYFVISVLFNIHKCIILNTFDYNMVISSWYLKLLCIVNPYI